MEKNVFIEKATSSKYIRAAQTSNVKFSNCARIQMKYEELMFSLGSKMIIQQKTSLAASLLMYRKEEDGTADNVIFHERIRVPKWIADYDHGEYAYRERYHLPRRDEKKS